MPVLRQRASGKRLFQESAIVLFWNEQAVHFLNRHRRWIAAQELERVSGSHGPFLLDGKIEATAAALEEALQNVVPLKFCRQLITRYARLAYHHSRGTDLKAIANVKLVLGQTLRREVLAKHAPGKVVAQQLIAPKHIMLRRVSVDRLVRAAMDAEIGLTVAVQVERTQLNRSMHRLFEDAGLDRCPFVECWPRHFDVQRSYLHRSSQERLCSSAVLVWMFQQRKGRTIVDTRAPSLLDTGGGNLWKPVDYVCPNPAPSIELKVCCPQCDAASRVLPFLYRRAVIMKIHEYQAKAILKKYGVSVPRGAMAASQDEAEAVAKDLFSSGASGVVVKAQIHAGGRGKGGGVKIAKSVNEAGDLASKMLGMKLVTHQTGPEGRIVRRLLIEETLPIE